ncbi:hypothetical protein [Methanoculleus caldifontis]|nr:hypothetical protein [Methanoculleus sp. Wushi-C6]
MSTDRWGCDWRPGRSMSTEGAGCDCRPGRSMRRPKVFEWG